MERGIRGLADRDAMGCYPLFACQDWSQLRVDVNSLRYEIVSLSLVADPFGEYEPAYLKRVFGDVVIPFKEHFVVDLSHPIGKLASSHHLRYARKALSQLVVEKADNPGLLLDEWVNLYANLIERHHIAGIAAFSKASFQEQLAVPGIVVFTALYADATVGMLLWYVQQDRAYYHLGAYSAAGYDLRASFALFRFAVEYFAESGLQWLDLGAGAGITGNGTDGLSRFKRGWSTGTRTAYFCGRVFDHRRYAEILKMKAVPATRYFPAYRIGEFG